MEIDINENNPHKVSEVICVKCCKRWIAVRPAATKLKDLECPNCDQGYLYELLKHNFNKIIHKC